jgi:hypothetical protein
LLLRWALLSVVSALAAPAAEEGVTLHYVQSGGSGGTGGNATSHPTLNCNAPGSCPQYNVGGSGGDGGSVSGSRRPGNNTAGGMSCDDLWRARNEIYARNGYCFKTPRAISIFGKGCVPPYGRLTGEDKARAKEIQRQERQQGC